MIKRMVANYLLGLIYKQALYMMDIAAEESWASDTFLHQWKKLALAFINLQIALLTEVVK